MPRVALVRGPGLSSYEMQSYEPLLGRYELHAFALERNVSDLSAMRIPFTRLAWSDSFGGRSLSNAYRARFKGQRYFMPGLERHLAGFDIVHSSEIATTYSWQVATARGKLGYRVVLTSTENILAPGWDAPERRKRKAEILAGTDMFLALTPDAKTVLLAEGIPDSKIRIVPFGLDLSRFRPGLADPQLRKKLGVRSGDFVVLFVGRLVWEKGLYELVGALCLLHQKTVRLVLAGDGPERASLRNYAKALGVDSQVVFADPIPYGDVQNIHRLADVLVLPSIPTRGVREQFGLVLVEAMACGKPVIATRCGSMPWVVGDAGLLINPADSGSLAQAIESLVRSPDLRKALTAEGLKLVSERYDSHRVAAAIRGAYESVLEDS